MSRPSWSKSCAGPRGRTHSRRAHSRPPRPRRSQRGRHYRRWETMSEKLLTGSPELDALLELPELMQVAGADAPAGHGGGSGATASAQGASPFPRPLAEAEGRVVPATATPPKRDPARGVKTLFETRDALEAMGHHEESAWLKARLPVEGGWLEQIPRHAARGAIAGVKMVPETVRALPIPGLQAPMKAAEKTLTSLMPLPAASEAREEYFPQMIKTSAQSAVPIAATMLSGGGYLAASGLTALLFGGSDYTNTVDFLTEWNKRQVAEGKAQVPVNVPALVHATIELVPEFLGDMVLTRALMSPFKGAARDIIRRTIRQRILPQVGEMTGAVGIESLTEMLTAAGQNATMQVLGIPQNPILEDVKDAGFIGGGASAVTLGLGKTASTGLREVEIDRLWRRAQAGETAYGTQDPDPRLQVAKVLSDHQALVNKRQFRDMVSDLEAFEEDLQGIPEAERPQRWQEGVQEFVRQEVARVRGGPVDRRATAPGGTGGVQPPPAGGMPQPLTDAEVDAQMQELRGRGLTPEQIFPVMLMRIRARGVPIETAFTQVEQALSRLNTPPQTA